MIKVLRWPAVATSIAHPRPETNVVVALNRFGLTGTLNGLPKIWAFDDDIDRVIEPAIVVMYVQS